MTENELMQEINEYLIEKFPNSIPTNIDIFEHGLLHYLKCKYVPKKCQFSVNDDGALCIKLISPDGISVETFAANLKNCLSLNRYRLQVSLHAIEASRFDLELLIPMPVFEAMKGKIFASMNDLLKSKSRHEFYEYWAKYVTRNGELPGQPFDVEEKMHQFLITSPYNSLEEAWGAIAQSNINKKLTFLGMKVCTDFENWPQVEFHYMDDEGKEISIKRDRQEIITTIENDLQSLVDNRQKNAFILPKDIQNFIKNTIERKANGNYVIHDLDYYEKQNNVIWDNLNIKFERIYPEESDDIVGCRRKSHVIFNPENYMKAAIAIKEMGGEVCLEERFHQLLYYCNHKKWDNLEETLLFLTNLSKIDYTELAFLLFNHMKENISVRDKQEQVEEILGNVEGVFLKIMENKNDELLIERASSALLEIRLMQMNSLKWQLPQGGAEWQIISLEKDIIKFARLSGKKVEAKRFLAEYCGFSFGETLNSDIDDADEMMLELARKIKGLLQEVANLEQKNACLEETLNTQGKVSKLGIFSKNVSTSEMEAVDSEMEVGDNYFSYDLNGQSTH